MNREGAGQGARWARVEAGSYFAPSTTKDSDPLTKEMLKIWLADYSYYSMFMHLQLEVFFLQ